MPTSIDSLLETGTLTYDDRIAALRQTKLKHTQEKWQAIGSMDFDDHALVLPPPESRQVVQVISGSGVPITDVLLKEFQIESNHSSGGIFGPRAVGRNFRRLLEIHPLYIDPMSSLAGAYRVNFMSYRIPAWNPDCAYPHLEPDIKKYKLLPGIGAVQHFCQDMTIGLTLGWGGLLDKIRRFRQVNRDDEAQALYDGLEDMVLGMQNWIGRHADEAERMSWLEERPQVRQNLIEIAAVNHKLVSDSPATFREAVQWMVWYQMMGKMYNMGGSLGRIDQFLYPFYRRDIDQGRLTDEEAVFHLACHFVMDTSYTQLGGPNAAGVDQTNELSFLVLEAAHRLKIPANIGVSVGKTCSEALLRRGVEILFADRTGIPKFLGVDNTSIGFARNGYPIELGRQRAYSGCHWCAIPGREYTMNDCVKINLAAVFETTLNDLMSDPTGQTDSEKLYALYEKHLRRAVEVTAECMDFHIDHMYNDFPELHLDLLCHGPIERGRDASHGGVEFVNLCLDAAGLATVADSFAALEQRLDREKRASWKALKETLDLNWSGSDGERMRLMMRSVPRYGQGGSAADDWALRISQLFTRLVKEKPTPHGYNMIPGIFSWAANILYGLDVGATPNGRFAQAPISHGPNPDPGFRKDGAPTALAVAVAAVQPGYGNTAPLQIELDPGTVALEDGVQMTADFIRSHFELGGTQININIVDKKKILAAYEDPEKYPDLVVRVTGFSAY
ncbi:formate acetyltransferase, partial [candidate division KSB1 bacterium]|nr:formate acetyltransferase [candidate division KSB1 bacterium]